MSPLTALEIWFLLFGYLLLSQVESRSIHLENANHANLQSRQCTDNAAGFQCDYFFPALSEIVTQIQDVQHHGQASPDTSACFWSGFDSDDDQLYAEMLQWVKSFGIPSCYFEFWSHQPVDKTWYKQQLDFISHHQAEFREQNPEYETFHEQFGLAIYELFKWCYWQALAAASLNPIAVLFAPGGLSLENTSIWAVVEIPALSINPNVERIYRADPVLWRRGPHEAYASPELLWQRGVDHLIPQIYPAFDCSAVTKKTTK